MKAKLTSLLVICTVFCTFSTACATLLTDAQAWINTNPYSMEHVDAASNTVKSEFWELTNASTNVTMTFYHEADPYYAFGLFPKVGPSITVFEPIDEPLDSATARFYVDDGKTKVVLTEHELYGNTKTNVYDFAGNTFGFWMGYMQDGGWVDIVNTYDDTCWLSVKMDEASYMFFGDVNSDGFLDMTVHAESINPAPVPEPATMLLFGTGLACFAGIARKKRNK